MTYFLDFALPITLVLLIASIGLVIWLYQKIRITEDQRNTATQTAEIHWQALQAKTEALQALQLLGIEAKQWEAQLQELKPQLEQLREESKQFGLKNATLTTEKAGLIQQLEGQQRRYATELAELKAQHEKAVQESKKEVSTLWDEKIKNHLTQTLKASAQEDEERRTLAFQQQTEPLNKIIEAYGEKVSKIGEAYNITAIKLDNEVKMLRHSSELMTSVMKTNKGAGDWGELQLSRILEYANLIEGIHYEKQPVLADNSRPDVKVRLTEERFMIIDAKSTQISTNVRQSATTTIDFDCEDNTEELSTPLKGEELVKSIKTATKDLASKVKNYTDNHSSRSPDYIILFLPKESLLSQAMEIDPTLWEEAWKQKVVISSPLTLVPLLRMVEIGWQQQNVEKNALEIQKLGIKIHERVIRFYTRLETVAKHNKSLEKDIKELQTAYDGTQGLVIATGELAKLGAKSGKVFPESASEAPYRNGATEEANHEPLALPTFSSASANN